MDVGYKEVHYTDKEVIEIIYNTVKKLNPNVKLEDFSRNPYKKEYIADFQHRDGYACCMFVDRYWLCKQFNTSRVWFTDNGIKVFQKV